MTPDHTTRVPRFDKETPILALVIALSLLASLVTIARYSVPHVDDAIMASISQNLYREGRLAYDMMGDLYGFNQADARVGRFFPVEQGAWLLVFGDSLAAVRAFSVFGAVLLAMLVYVVGLKLYDRTTGLLAAAILLVGPRLFGASHIGRQEIWVMVGTFTVLVYYLYVRTNPTRLRFFFLGLLTLVPVQQHLNGIWFIVPIMLLVAADNLRVRQDRLNILAFGAGGLIAVMMVVALQLVPDPQLAFQQFSPANGLHAAELDASLLARLGSQLELMLYGWLVSLPDQTLGYPTLIAAVLYVLFLGLSVARLAYRRTASDRVLLTLWVVSYLAFAVGMSHKNTFYAALWDPFIALIIAATFGQELPERFRQVNRLLWAAPLLAAGLGLQLWMAYRMAPYDYDRFSHDVSANIPPGKVVLGDGALWFALQGQNTFYAESYFAMWGCGQPADIGTEELLGQMQHLAIEYVIFDGILPAEIACANPITPATASSYAALLEDLCTTVATVPGPTYRGGRYPAQGETSTIYHCPTFSSAP